MPGGHNSDFYINLPLFPSVASFYSKNSSSLSHTPFPTTASADAAATMFPNNLPLHQTKIIFSAAVSSVVSAGATYMFIRSVARDVFPRELRGFLLSKLPAVLSSFSSQLTFIIQEFDGLTTNHLFRAAELYLEHVIAPNAPRLKLTMPKKEDKISISMEKNHEIVDTFNGIKIRWKLISKKNSATYISSDDPYYNKTIRSDLKCYELSFHKKHKEKVLTSYLNHVLQKSNELEEKKKTLKLFTMKSDRSHGGKAEMWQSVNLDHPSTFETLALDFEIKKSIIEDLERFVKRKEFYRRVGKAWKRGYLLYGPPGTGKSSLIAAMANYLSFDIYDLELTDLKANSDLRRLLISTRNKSILVVEDIDCSIELQDRIAAAKAKNPRHFNGGFPGFNEGNYQVTLSGLLNFIDGLWSSCGDERIIVLTTNHKDKLDPALLRPGRMDLHIHMSYCTPTAFKMLASNYLQITHHSHFSAVEELLQTTKVTPAEVGEQLMKNEVPDVALTTLIEFLEEKKRKVYESETEIVELGEVGVEGAEEKIRKD